MGTMADEKHSGPRPDWQDADPRVLGQILAAQNVVLALPTTASVAEFYAQALLAIPGVRACRVCLGEVSAQAGGTVLDCEALRSLVARGFPTHADGLELVPVRSLHRQFGYFAVDVGDARVFATYKPFVGNLASYVAVSLESRSQHDLLQKAHDELERKVAERTRDLSAANEALIAANLVAGEMMRDAVLARDRLERANEELQREIAERRQAEESARHVSERLSVAARAASLGIWDWNIVTNELVWDDRMYELYGVRRGDFPGAYEAWLSALHPDDRAAADEVSRQVREGQREYDTEFRAVWPDGSVRYIKAYGRVLRDDAGRPLRMIGVNFDITERRRADEEIRQLNAELEHRVAQRTDELTTANKELEAFSYSVSHDLRAPLRHIDGFLGLMRERLGSSLDDRSRGYMDAVSDAAQRMGKLVDDLLAFSRMGRAELSTGVVRLDRLAQEAIREVGGDAAGRRVLFSVGSLPTVSGDEAMLRTVLVNLVSNALKFTKRRDPAHIELGTLDGHEHEHVVFVRDDGVGFDPAYAHKLFGVFQRLHRVDEFEGTGIGLASVRRIISRHGGRTWAEGTPGGGATFYFTLPRRPDL